MFFFFGTPTGRSGLSAHYRRPSINGQSVN
jgi:hypothetical protein